MAMVRDREDDRRSRRWTWIFLGVVAAIPFLALFTVYMAFDPNDHKAEIIDRVRKATGRELILGGPIRMKLALRPTVEVTDVSFSNMEGGARPEMLRVARLQARLGLAALLQRRVEIDQLILERPDILLETDAQGRANWRMTPAGGQAGAPRTAGGGPGGFAVEIRELRMTDANVTWNKAGAAPVSLPLARLQMDAEAANAPMAIALETAWNGVAVNVNGQVGSLAGLQGLSASPWPFRLVVTSVGAKLNLTGALANPTQGKSYQLKLDGTAPDLAALSKLAGGAALPALREVAVTAQLRGEGDGLPEITDVSLRAGESDLDPVVSGLKLNRLEIAAPKLAEAMKIDALATLGTLPMVLGASIGTPLAVLGHGTALPIEMNLTAAGAAFSARGQIADPSRLAGMDIVVAASVPDAQALGAAAAGGEWPALRDLRAQARLGTGTDGIAGGFIVREFALAQPHAEMMGEGSIRFAPRRAVQANVTARRIDLDALRPPAAPNAAPSPRAARAGGKVIPDTPLPFAAMRDVDADIQLSADELIQGGEATRNLALRLVLRDGQLKLDPFSADLPAGKVTASLTADVTKPARPVALQLRSPGLALKQLYNDLGRDGDATGLVEVDLDLRGAGLTPREIASRADGHLGLAIVGGTIDNRILNLGLIGDLLRSLKLGEVLGRGGSSQLRCFALRVDAQNGVGDVRALLLDASTLLLEGGGRLNLAEESLALRMKVQPRLSGLSITLPIRVGGSFAAPRAAPDPSGLLGAPGQTANSAAGTATDMAGSGANAVTGALGLGGVPSSGPPDACATQLAIARGSRAGTGTQAPAAPASRSPRSGRGTNPLQRLLP